MRSRISLLLLSLLALCTLSACAAVDDAEQRFQNDADLIRLEHLIYWTGLVEEYAARTGAYPLQNTLGAPGAIGLVNIVTAQQYRQLPGADRYEMKTVRELVRELESGLGRPIDEMYDIQVYATESPVGYNYFFTDRGYLLRVPCITCGTTAISPLTGVTPLVTVASAAMKGDVQGALARDELLAHPLYQTWSAKPFILEEHARSVVAGNIRDSKQ